MRDKPLFPHICFRNVTVQVNMGPNLLKPLPFSCQMLQSAAESDVIESKECEVGTPGIYNVMMPVAIPDEGTFDWLDEWLEAHPSWVELSDRKLQQWAVSSGLSKPKGGSQDKPSFAYGITGMEDLSLQKVINAIAPTIPRNYVVMEVKSNLLATDRAEVLRRFSLPYFKKTAMVVMGKPTEDFKDRLRARILREKQAKADNEWRLKKAQREQQRQLLRRRAELAEFRRKAEENRRKLLEEAMKKADDKTVKDELNDEEKLETKEEKETKEEEAPETGQFPIENTDKVSWNVKARS